VSDTPPGFPIQPPGPSPEDQPALTDEQRMLVDLRDKLYEGNWEDFRRDLKARQESKPYVFDVVPPTPRLRETIARHLRVIDELDRWERHYQRTLRSSA
jgi:hypothetical protein